MKTIRTGIIGYGRSGQELHGPALRANPEFEVVAVADPGERSREQARRDFGCAVYEDYPSMLQSEALDLVVVVTRNDQHCSMGCDALRAGANLLVTKPLGVNAAEVKEMMAVANAAGRTIYPFLPARWGTDLEWMQEVIRSGAIGDVFCVRRAQYGFATRDDWQTQTQFGGGILLNWGPHLVDSPLYLLGSKPVTVMGYCDQLLNPGDAEDQYFAVITLENGARIHSEWSYAAQGLPNWFVQGTRGTLSVTGTEWVLRKGEPAQPTDPTQVKAMQGDGLEETLGRVGDDVFGNSVEIYKDLAGTMQHQSPFRVCVEEALTLAELLDGVKESHRQGKPVKVGAL